ncbi:hypothetical protein McanCB49686_000777 [Microsporum canis]
MVSRRVKISRFKKRENSSDNAAQESMNANSDDKKEEPQPVEGDGVATGTTSTTPEDEEAGVASPQEQDQPEQSDANADVELDDTPADSAAEAEEAPASEKSSPTPAENLPLARTSLAYFFSPTPHPTQSQSFPPSRLSSSSFSACSLPVAPPPSPASPCHPQYAAAAYYQVPPLPNPRPYLPQMYPGSHRQGQPPYSNNNNMSRWMPPMMGTPGMVPGNVQYPQQGNIQRSIFPVLPFRPVVPLNALGRPPATSRTAYVSRPVAVVPTSTAPVVQEPSVPANMSSTPSSPSADTAPTPIKPKKNEYKGPLIVSSSPVRPPSQSQSAQQTVQPVQQPLQQVQQPVQQQRPFVSYAPTCPVTTGSQLFMSNPGHGYNGHNTRVRNGHNTNNNNNVVAAPYYPTSFTQMPMLGPLATAPQGNGLPNSNGPHGLNNNTLAAPTHFARSFPIEDPFEAGTGPRPAPAGAVLKISNIPYNLLTREVIHFLGRRAKLLPESRGTSVHIIMERSTAKTMDCYVELLTQADAQEALSWVNRNLPAHSPRLGDRHVLVEMSSQDELLREMFPRAKCVLWKNGFPEVQPNTDRYSTGFQGFLTNEELFCMVHYTEAPKRAPFAEKCPQRPYEFMISTLDKFPWSSRSLYTVEHRNVLFDATRRQLRALVIQVNARRVVQLDARLLRDLLNAGLRCPTFNERQKYLLRVAAGQEQGGIPRTAMFWPFDALSRKPGAREESVEEYARLIRAAVLRRVPNLGELNNSWDAIQHGNSPFGPLMLEWQGEGARRSLQAAINTEIGVMRTLISEGLAAVNTAV